jgi:hypothetical protein
LLSESNGAYKLAARTLQTDPYHPGNEWASAAYARLLITDTPNRGSDLYFPLTHQPRTMFRFAASNTPHLTTPQTCNVPFHDEVNFSTTDLDPDGGPVISQDELELVVAAYQLLFGQSRVTLILILWKDDLFDSDSDFSCSWLSFNGAEAIEHNNWIERSIQRIVGQIRIKELTFGWRPFCRVSAPARPGIKTLELRDVVARIRQSLGSVLHVTLFQSMFLRPTTAPSLSPRSLVTSGGAG